MGHPIDREIAFANRVINPDPRDDREGSNAATSRKQRSSSMLMSKFYKWIEKLKAPKQNRKPLGSEGEGSQAHIEHLEIDVLVSPEIVTARDWNSGPHQVLEQGSYSFLCDAGSPCVVLVDLEHLSVLPGDRLSLEEDEDATYWVYAVLPLDASWSKLRNPVAVLLHDAEPGGWVEGDIDFNRWEIAEFRSHRLGPAGGGSKTSRPSEGSRAELGAPGLVRGRFDHLSHEECRALLRELEGPLLELALSGESGDVSAADVFGEVWYALSGNPRVQRIFPTTEELEAWERFKGTRGEGASEIGEFVYGPDENPWHRDAEDHAAESRSRRGA